VGLGFRGIVTPGRPYLGSKPAAATIVIVASSAAEQSIVSYIALPSVDMSKNCNERQKWQLNAAFGLTEEDQGTYRWHLCFKLF
jgi:hypothetical protein